MKNINVLFMFVILAIIFAALWIGSQNSDENGNHHNHHHEHNLGPGGQLQPTHTHIIGQ